MPASVKEYEGNFVNFVKLGKESGQSKREVTHACNSYVTANRRAEARDQGLPQSFECGCSGLLSLTR